MLTTNRNTDTYRYYINTSKTIIFSHNVKINKMKRVYKSDWASYDMEVLKLNKKTSELETLMMDWESIVKEDNDIFKVIKPIASTTKQAGFFEEFDYDVGLNQNFLNEYLNSEKFIEAKNTAKDDENDPLNMLRNNCPNISLLLTNLFHNESDIVLQNFLNWLAVIAYKNERQDVFWLFKGTDEDNQGQGAGKGVFRDLMTELLSGLVVSVNNNSYKSNFNSKLMNMKLIIFDEVDLKSLNYEVVKDMTGSSTMPIEFKGKEVVQTDNVASWLFFTNMYDLFNKIILADRRCFIIHPNPENDSLIKIVDNMDSFIHSINEELLEFINVLAYCDLEVMKPNKLKTNAHIEYFSKKALSSITELSYISKIFTNKEDRATYFEFLEDLQKIEPELDYTNQRFFIENKFSYYKVFLEIYDVCSEHKIAGISSKISPQKAWKHFKEELYKSSYTEYKLDRKVKINDETKRIKEACIRHSGINKVEQKKITDYIVKMYKQDYTAINNTYKKAS
jgi:hypothetical protein